LVPPAGLRVQLNPPMRKLKAVSLTLQTAPGVASVARVEVSNKTGQGFTLRAFDAINQPVPALIDCVAQGY
jgi:hypothetical protein